jgi:hypothetical protein
MFYNYLFIYVLWDFEEAVAKLWRAPKKSLHRLGMNKDV